jgi:hypothetical protein
MTEATVRASLVKKLRLYKDWLVLRHEDHYTSGIPDISITGNKITSWIETKFQKTLGLYNKGIQQYTLEQLDRFGYARYIIYTPENVAIVTPTLSDPLIFEGHDHSAVVEYFRNLHKFPR